MERTQKPMLQLFCLCDEIGRVEGSSKLIIIGVFEQLEVEELPAVHPKLWVFARFTGGVGTFACRNQIVDPEGRVIFETEDIPFTLEVPEQSHNVSGQLMGLPIESEGTHWVETYLDDELIAQIPLMVQVVHYEAESTEPAAPTFH